MGFFFKALAAMVTADAIDRHTRSRPTRYWYPDQPDLPPPGSQIPYVSVGQRPAAQRRQPPPDGWDFEHPERPSRPANHR
jgi:hypothetical protein